VLVVVDDKVSQEGDKEPPVLDNVEEKPESGHWSTEIDQNEWEFKELQFEVRGLWQRYTACLIFMESCVQTGSWHSRSYLILGLF
jgi:hypothetical protein